MKKLSRTGIVALAILALAVLSGPAQAGKPQSFHCSGSGVFSPTNLGTAKGGNAGIIVGDGTGFSQYTAAGDAFTIGGESVGSGMHLHVGENYSRTTGIFKKGQNQIIWPAISAENHILSSEDGDVEFKYVGRYILDPATGIFTADALFIIVGGKGRFEGAKGMVWIDVAVPFALPGLPPPGVSPDIPFDYDFNGFIILDD